MPSRSSECGNETCPFSEFNDVSDHILSRLQIADAIIWRPDEGASLPSFFAVGPDGKAAFVLRGETINSDPGVKATIFKFVVSTEGIEAMLRRVKRTKLLEKRIRRTWEHGLSGPDCRATDDVLFSCDRERGKRDHPARFDYPDDRGQTGAAWRGGRRRRTPELPPVLLGFDNSLFGKWSTASAREPREDLFRGIRCRSDRHCYYWVLGERAVNRPSIESPSLLPHSPSRSPPIPKLVLDLFWVGSKSRFNSASPMTRDFCPAKRVGRRPLSSIGPPVLP